MTMRTGNFRSARRQRRGAVMVEFAIVIPIFLLAITGILEFGRAIMVQQILTNAAREGARRAIIPGATDSQVETLVNNYLDSASLGAATVNIVDSSGVDASLADLGSHSVVGVEVTVPYDQVSFGLGAWFGGSTMAALVQMRRE